MNYLKIEKENIGNGPGIRTVLWVAGCNHKCKNCQNPETWDYTKGKLFTEDSINEIIKDSNSKYISGLTISGGDPLSDINNIPDLIKLVKTFKTKFPDKTIWVWTGNNFDEMLNNKDTWREFLSYIDILIDGIFREDIRKLDLMNQNSKVILHYRGSSNQRIINVPESLKNGRTIILEDKIKNV